MKTTNKIDCWGRLNSSTLKSENFYLTFKNNFPKNLPSPPRLCRKSVHGSTSSPRTDHGTLKINYLAVRPEPFDSPFTLSLSKGERFAQDRLVEGRTVNCDTVSPWEGKKGRGDQSILSTPTAPSPKRLWRVGDLTLPHRETVSQFPSCHCERPKGAWQSLCFQWLVRLLRSFHSLAMTLRHSLRKGEGIYLENFKYACLILMPFLLSAPSIGYTDTGDILSRFQLYGTVQETYDNNVDLTPRNKRDDFITNVSLGLRFSTLPRSETTREFRQPSTTEETRYGIYLDFLPGYVFYAKQTNDNYLSLSGNLDTWYTWDRKLTFRVRDSLIRSEEPLEQAYAVGALPGQILLGSQRRRAIYVRNVVQPSLEYRFGREDIFSINYLNNVYRNQKSSLFEDSTENFINPRLTYWFNIRNGLSLDYGLTLGNFQRSPDLISHTTTARYTYRFNPMTSVFGEYTFLSRNFKSPGIDYDVHRPSFGIEHAFSPALSGRGQLGYFWQNPEKGSKAGGFFYDVSATQRAERTTYTLGLQGGYTEDYFTAENLGFAKYHQVIGTITHQLTQKAAATFSGRYQRPKYNNGQVDNIWGVTTGTSYRILRWLTLALDLSYAEDHSNREVNNYTDFRGIFRITATSY